MPNITVLAAATGLPAAILPCPFCGSEAAFGTIRYGAHAMRELELEQDTYHFCNCTRCGVSNKSLLGYATPDSAATAWNARANGDHGVLEAMKAAEQFMAGFEDDETQAGLSAKLAAVRSAIAKVEGRA